MFDPGTAIIQAKVTLEDIAPPIWRQLLLPPTLNLAELHHVLQAAFGWLDCHLHQFVIGGLCYGAPELLEQDVACEHDPQVFEATLIRLRDFEWTYTRPIQFLYVYDFGDDWRHRVTLETLIAPDSTRPYPACIAGARAHPPEDVGGVSGYAEFLHAWRNPDHQDPRDMRRWAGRSFDPERFDLAKTDKAVRSAVRKARKDYVFRPD
jgi:hypothetical protein